MKQKNSKTQLGFGILGAGMISPFHAKSIQGIDGARLVAFADIFLDNARKRADEFGCKAYGDLESMLNDPEIDVVNIVTPNHLHYDAVLACAAHGKHVIVEKPPSISLREIDGMIEACEKAGVLVTCMVNCRTRSAIRSMKSAVEAGRFGRILQADTYMKWYRSSEYYQSNDWRKDQRAGAGVTIQQAFHYIDLLQHLAGPVKSVHARMCNLTHPDVQLEDSVQAFFEYVSGATGTVQATTACWPGTDVRIELNGENGTAIMSGEVFDTWKFKEEISEDEATREIGSGAQATAASGPASLGFHEHQRVVEDMVEAIITNRKPSIQLSSVRHSLEICLAMYQSARTNKTVTLPLADEDHVWG